jgi:ATP-dependent DNA helicase RecG
MYADELKHKITILRGIGKETAKSFAKININNVSDLIKYVPRAFENRKDIVPLANYREGPINTFVEINGHDYIGFGSNKTLKVHISDETGSAILVCFGRNFLSQKLIVGRKFFIYGLFEYKFNNLQTSTFQIEEFSSHPVNFNKIIPVYPLSGKLNQGILRRAIREAIDELARFTKNQIPEYLLHKYNFISRNLAIENIHFPESINMLKEAERALRYEELFYLQLTVGRKSKETRKYPRKKIEHKYNLQKQLISKLPFFLTDDQETVLKELKADMELNTPMTRLLQGDVGSGKTLIAFISALGIIESGGQVAFMAPTELLAKQHAENAAKLMTELGIRLAFLSGNVKNSQRKPLLSALARGDIDLIIGTHALFTGNVEFKNLEFVIVDEQHKFGVLQRLALLKKGNTPDLLLMTATPIPRTLTLTLFGDMDVSVIKTMPEGRKPVLTHLSSIENETKVYEAVRKELERGHQAYFVYPRIQDGETTDNLKDAEGMYIYLREKIFPEFKLGLIHSKLQEEEKIKAMDNFVKGVSNILVATSVVEVGVDIPNASCMVIEHAEYFGLSGLHQLRGRVGRGKIQSYAFLIYSKDLSEIGKIRLKTMKKFKDGFSISEEDLKLRGPGELAGSKQSGFLNLTYADLIRDFKILEIARTDAFNILEKDPGFLDPEHTVIREVFDKCEPFKGAIEND